jgi:hypothetical protein
VSTEGLRAAIHSRHALTYIRRSRDVCVRVEHEVLFVFENANKILRLLRVASWGRSRLTASSGVLGSGSLPDIYGA